MQHITPKRRSSTLRTLLTFEDNRRASEMRLRESKPAKKKTEAENIWNCKVRLLQKSYFNIFHTMIKLSWPHRDCRNRTCMTIKVSTSFNNVPTCSYSVMKRSILQRHNTRSTCIFESSIHLNRTSHLLHNAEEPATSQGSIVIQNSKKPMRVGNSQGPSTNHFPVPPQKWW